MESAEKIFLRYSFPCAQVLLDKGKITEEEYERLKSAAIGQGTIGKDELERFFQSAFRRLKMVFGESYWKADLIRDYFINHHNNFIDAGEGEYGRAPEYFKRLCKVHTGIVVSRKDDALIVEVTDQKRAFVGLLISDEVQQGDRVTVHLGFAIEKV